MTDKIFLYIQTGDYRRAYSLAYAYFPKVKKYILHQGGTKADAEDIFQGALMVFTAKAEQVDFKLNAGATTFIFGICKVLWKAHCRKENKSVAFTETMDREIDEEEILEKHEQELKYKKLGNVLLRIGEKCRQILLMFYAQHLNMKVIAEKTGLKSEKIAKNQKYKCLEKAKEMIRNH